MTIIAGFSSAGLGPAPLNLAAQIARGTREQVIAAAIIESPRGRRPEMFEVEYLDHVSEQARKSLQELASALPDELDVELVVHRASSVPAGLTDLAAQVRADIVVVGSSSSGALGRIALGSVTDRLVHTAAVPVAIAPRGYPAQPSPVQRLTVAYGGRADEGGLVAAAAELAQRWSAQLRIASFTVRPVTMFSGAIETGAEDLVVEQWARSTQEAIAAQLETVRSGIDHLDPEVVIGAGATWRDAVEAVSWAAGDILVLGSGAAGPVARVFLGSAAAKILRHAPVPTMIVPRRSEA